MKIKIILLIFCCFVSLSYSAKQSLPTANGSNFYDQLQLGSLVVKSSTKSVEAKKHIELGMKFLHTFMYDMARAQFIEAQKNDKHAAMAYYGEIMTQKHLLWQYENVSEAQAIIAKSKRHVDLKSLLPVEKNLLQSSYYLFEGKKSSKERFEKAIAYLSQQDTNKSELEFSLLLLVLKLGYISEFPDAPKSMLWLKSGRLAIAALHKKYPKHPGVIHYHLHYFDSKDINIAKHAKNSAKAAATLLTSSSHLAHMSAHIYRRLGLWALFIEANQRSIIASDALCQQQVAVMDKSTDIYHCDADNRYHALEWLHFGALKANKTSIARKVLVRIKHDAEKVQSDVFYGWYYRMWARQVLSQSQPIQKILTPVRKITKKNADTYWMAYSESGALLANGILKLQYEKNVGGEITRFNSVIQYAKNLTDTYVYHASKMNKFLLLAIKAEREGKYYKKNEYLKKAMEMEMKLVSTEVTPSLNFINTHDFKNRYLKN